MFGRIPANQPENLGECGAVYTQTVTSIVAVRMIPLPRNNWVLREFHLVFLGLDGFTELNIGDLARDPQATKLVI